MVKYGQAKKGSSHEAPAPLLATNFLGGYAIITMSAHYS